MQWNKNDEAVTYWLAILSILKNANLIINIDKCYLSFLEPFKLNKRLGKCMFNYILRNITVGVKTTKPKQYTIKYKQMPSKSNVNKST